MPSSTLMANNFDLFCPLETIAKTNLSVPPIGTFILPPVLNFHVGLPSILVGLKFSIGKTYFVSGIFQIEGAGSGVVSQLIRRIDTMAISEIFTLLKLVVRLIVSFI